MALYNSNTDNLQVCCETWHVIGRLWSLEPYSLHRWLKAVLTFQRDPDEYLHLCCAEEQYEQWATT